MRKIVWITFLCSLAFISCQQEEWTESTATASGGTVIRLRSDGYDNREETRASAQETDAYDRVEFCVADEDGYIVKTGSRKRSIRTRNSGNSTRPGRCSWTSTAKDSCTPASTRRAT